VRVVLLGLAVALSPAPGLATVGLVGLAVLLVLWAPSRPKEGLIQWKTQTGSSCCSVPTTRRP
jgi:hypothetical protein